MEFDYTLVYSRIIRLVLPRYQGIFEIQPFNELCSISGLWN